jgi:hypothetical protein
MITKYVMLGADKSNKGCENTTSEGENIDKGYAVTGKKLSRSVSVQ